MILFMESLIFAEIERQVHTSNEPRALLVRNSVSVRVILNYEPVQRQRKERFYTVKPTGALYVGKFQNPKALRNPD